jgi:hypothetical protein
MELNKVKLNPKKEFTYQPARFKRQIDQAHESINQSKTIAKDMTGDLELMKLVYLSKVGSNKPGFNPKYIQISESYDDEKWS